MKGRIVGIIRKRAPVEESGTTPPLPTRDYGFYGDNNLPSGNFLPPPRIPMPGEYPPAEVVDSVVGAELVAPLRRYEAAVAAAVAARDDLMTHRPGGPAVREAFTADAADQAAGTPPKRWRVEVILNGDYRRWAEAHARARAVPLVARQCAADLDLNAIRKAAADPAKTRAREFASAADSAWAVRDDDVAFPRQRRAAEEPLARWRTAYCVDQWAAGHGWTPPDGCHAVPDEAAGTWWAVWLAANPNSAPLEIPRDIRHTLPPGAKAMTERRTGDVGSRGSFAVDRRR